MLALLQTSSKTVDIGLSIIFKRHHDVFVLTISYMSAALPNFELDDSCRTSIKFNIKIKPW